MRFPNKNFVEIVNNIGFPIDNINFANSELCSVTERIGKSGYTDYYAGKFLMQENDKVTLWEYRSHNIWLRCGIPLSNINEFNSYKNAKDIRLAYVEPIDIYRKFTPAFTLEYFEDKPVYEGTVFSYDKLDNDKIKVLLLGRSSLIINQDYTSAAYKISFGNKDEYANIIDNGMDEGFPYIIYDGSELGDPEINKPIYIININRDMVTNYLPEYLFIAENDNEYGVPSFEKTNFGGYLTNKGITKSYIHDNDIIYTKFTFNSCVNGAGTWGINEFKDYILVHDLFLYDITENTLNEVTAIMRPYNERLDDNNGIGEDDYDIAKEVYNNIGSLPFGELVGNNLDVDGEYFLLENMNEGDVKRLTLTSIYKYKIPSSCLSKIKLLMSFKVK